MKTPLFLSPGSKIALVAPARKVTLDDITFAIEYIKNKGFVPVYDERLFLADNQFAGNDEERAAVLQSYLDDSDIDAIMCVRKSKLLCSLENVCIKYVFGKRFFHFNDSLK